MNNHKLILLEGMDATGKTFVAKKLTKELNASYIHAPRGNSEFTTSLYNNIIKRFPDIDDSTKMLLFLAAHKEVLKEAIVEKVFGNVICDRSLLSTLVYQKVGIDYFRKVLQLHQIPPLPYTTAIVLTAPKETIVERLGRRKSFDSLDDFFLKNFDEIENAYLNYSKILYPDCHIIDTGNLNKNEVYTRIKKILML